MTYDEKDQVKIRSQEIRACNALLALLELHHPGYSPKKESAPSHEPILAVPDSTAERLETGDFLVLEIPDFLPKNPKRRSFPPNFWPIIGKPMPTLRLILQCVSTHLGVGPIDIISQRRTSNLIYPRHLCYWLMRSMTTHGLPTIGRTFGGRDHTTILHGCRKINALVLGGDKRVMHDVAAIKQLIERSLGEIKW